MFHKIKQFMYFPVASYFAFFAKIFLLRWSPKIIVITGSSGKTTLLHMLESQIGNLARYSHHANSSFGIPFDILGIHRHTLSILEWPKIFLSTPLAIFKSVPGQKIYIVEADSDRPGEAKFISSLLNQDITIWLNVSKTHSMNFEKLVNRNNPLEKVITSEFGNFIKKSKELSIINSDSDLILNQANCLKTKILHISKKFAYKYQVNLRGTEFEVDNKVIKFKYLLPEETIYQILATKKLLEYLDINFNDNFENFKLPPGRSSFFKGIKNINIIDSTYNANLDSMKVILNLFNKIDSTKKWIIFGDMLEQGKNEEMEHKLLAEEINRYNFEKIILMGPRVKKHTLPYLKNKNNIAFIYPNEVLEYLLKNINGGETILFKGARFLEGVIERLLLDKNDAKNLVRRELVWQKRREKFGL